MSERFRPVIFNNILDIVGKTSLKQVVANLCKQDCLLIQDVEDMVIEKWSISDLKLLQDNGVSFYGFKLNENLEVEVFSSIFVSRYLDYLKGLITFREYFANKIVVFDSLVQRNYGVRMKYANKLLDLTIIRVMTGQFFLFLNDKCLMSLRDNNLLGNSYSNEIRYFKIVQVCRTKAGFEIVLFLPISLIFLGLCLSDELDLISVVNIPKEPDLFSVTHEDYKSIIVKSKLIA